MSSIREAKEVADAIRAAWQRGQSAALATLIAVRGSAYRRPGAKMMMAADNQMWGTLSGGCLEGDLYGWAERVMASQVPHIQSYDLGERDMWSLGIGCKGAVDVWIQPVSQHDAFWQETFRRLEGPGAVSTVMQLPDGLKAGALDDGTVWGDWDRVPETVRRALSEHRARATRVEILEYEGVRFALDTMRPPERLIVCGAGHDALPVAAMATSAGFAVTVLDPRETYNTEERLPTAEVRLVAEPETVEPGAVEGAYWVIMNHYQERDEHCLALALKARPLLIGVLGPLSRTHEMLENIGAAWSDGPIQAPIGLDLGAETIDEVAVSIVADLMRSRRGKSAQPLAGRAKIHE